MGKLYGIGVGPGDPELLTLKAYRILKEADIIFCPEKEAGAGSFAFDIIKDLLKDTKATDCESGLSHALPRWEAAPDVGGQCRPDCRNA